MHESESSRVRQATVYLIGPNQIHFYFDAVLGAIMSFHRSFG